MPTINTKSIGSGGGRDYSTLTAWETGRQGNLPSLDYVEVGECYNDSAFLNLSFAFYGWTTDATRYIHLKSADGEEHSGIINTGVQFTRNADLSFNSQIQVREDYVRIEGIEFHPYGYASTKYSLYIYDQTATTNQIRVFNCIFFGNDSSTACNHGVMTNSSNTNLVFYNNIMYRWPNTSWIEALYPSACASAYIYNNTFYKCWRGVQSGGSQCLVINNVSMGCYNADFSGTVAGSSDYNCSSDTSAPDNGNSLVSKTASNQFTNVSAGSEDFHVKDNAADIYNAGQDLTSDPNFAFNTDIDYQTRPTGAGTWDIGADEIASDTEDMSPIVAQRYYSVHKNGLTIIKAECQLRDIMSDFGDRVSIDIGRPKEAFTKAVITQVSRHFLDKYRVTITAVAGGYQDNEDEAWEVS